MAKIPPPFPEDPMYMMRWYQHVRDRLEKPILQGNQRIIGNILQIGKNIFSAVFEKFGNSAYLVLDKLTEEDDASIVMRQMGAVKWEVGATTELAGTSNDLHIKRVTGASNAETFTDVFLWKYDTGDAYVVDGFKFGVGTVPVELFHVAKTSTDGRAAIKFENANTSGGGTSESAAVQFAGANSSWTVGNDFGLNGGNNWFVQSGSGVVVFAATNGLAINGSTLAATEAFRVNSTTGGLLLPRMTTTQRDAMGGKNAGLVIFNTTTAQAELWDGSSWIAL